MTVVLYVVAFVLAVCVFCVALVSWDHVQHCPTCNPKGR